MKGRRKNKSAALARIAKQIESCRRCRQQALGKPVAGEGSPDAEIVFVGEAPGRMEAESGRPFVGKAGQWLRRAIRGIGLDESSVYLTSPVKYRPARGKPNPADIAHGRVHLLQQLDVLDPKIVVLLGSAACLGVLNEKVAVRARHGTVIERDGRTYLINSHPAAAARFPAIGKAVRQDFKNWKRSWQS
jgi:DNA polymerase